MQPREIMQAELIDILFENRNKQYGAYRLRRQYNGRLLRALCISVGGVFAVILLFSFKTEHNAENGQIQTFDTLVIKEIDPPKKDQPPASPVTPTPPTNTIKSNTPLIVSDDSLIKDSVPTQDLLIKNIISTSTHTSDSVLDNFSAAPPISDQGNEPAINEADDKGVYDQHVVDEEAGFPGGLQALARFMNRNLRDPRDGNLEEDAKDIKVQVKFVVDREGATGGFEIITSGGQVFDEAVIRALKKMPKWKPATWRSKKVAMYYVMPVTFAVSRD